MRELDKRVAQAAQRLICGPLLLVGAQSGTLDAVSALERPDQAVAGEYESALWVAAGDALTLRTGIAALRTRLLPGARLLLAVRRKPPVVQRVRGLLGGPMPEPVALSTLCGALLASGLCAPQVHEGTRDHHLLSATLPRDPCSLDVFFTQPSTS
ncbi:MAG TPA: hypothetical protein VI299_07300 [Polyangiales bacterium]